MLAIVLLCNLYGVAQVTLIPHGTTAPGAPGIGPYDLTPTIGTACHSQVGVLWANPTVDFTRSFIIDFEASYNVVFGQGGDGICVVFGEFSNATTPGGGGAGGGTGGNLGYYAADTAFNHNTFAVEFDTWNNGGPGERAEDHTNTAFDGIDSPSPLPSVPIDISATIPLYIKDSVYRSYKIVWDFETKTLFVYCNCNLCFASHFDYASRFHSYKRSAITWGFTASTGGYCSNQIVRNVFLTYPSPPATTYITHCGGGGEVLGGPVGTSTIWHPSGHTTSSETVYASGIYSATSYYTTASCNINKKIYDVTFIDTPTVSVTMAPVACIGTAFTFSVTGTPALSDVEYDLVGTSGTITSLHGTLPYFLATVPSTLTGSPGTICFRGKNLKDPTGTCTFPWHPFICVNIAPADPGIITGPSLACVGVPFTLTDANYVSPDYTWHIRGPGTFTPSSGSSTITVTPTGTGVITVTCIVSNTCVTDSVVKTITVDPQPAAITGPSAVCMGSTITLADATPGGTWSSSDGLKATVSATGVVTPGSAGVVTISYTTSGHCTEVYLVTINPLPQPIVGAPTVCSGKTTPYTDVTPGGTWTSSAPLIALIDATGLITGGTPGTATITYTITSTGCYVTKTITTLPSPAAISGASRVCETYTTLLTDAPSGGTWSSSDPGIGSIDITTGVVTGVHEGVCTISYTLPNGCYEVLSFTVDPLPSFDGGPMQLCVGDSQYIAGYLPGGTYSSSNTLVATVTDGGPTSGYVTGVSAGTATISYTSTFGCLAVKVVTVNPLPGPILGKKDVCVGLTNGLSDADAGGSWGTSDALIASIDASTGIYTGVNEGTCTVTYWLPTGCKTIATLTVNPNPVLTGTARVCETMMTTLTADILGGTWTSGSIPTATVDPVTGDVTGIAGGTATITYVAASGCASTVVVTVIPIPAPIIGPDSACRSGTFTFSMADATAGGKWSSSNTLIASIGSVSGFVTMHAAGSVIFTYTVPSGCYVTKSFMVQDVPLIPPVTGIPIVCPGTTTTLMDIYAGGGTWSTSATTLTVNVTTGVVTGVSVGTGIITFTATNNCGDNWAYKTVTVVPVSKPITGIRGICSGNTTTLSNEYGGGTWTSLNTGVATVDPVTGIVTGIIPGTATIQYDGVSPCGLPFTVTMIVAVDMDPFITTNFLVACQNLIDLPFGSGFTMPSKGCALVCEGSTVRYYGNGVSGSVFTWSVSGGTVVANYGDSIDVLWPTVGITGSVNLADTFSHCIGEAHNCIQVISKPKAGFSASGTRVCLGGSISFTDLSTCDPYSPIKDWRWDFGDGTYSSLPCPDHKFTINNTVDTVTLVVTNACGCADTMRMMVSVSDKTSPDILCTSVACDSELANYSTPPTCGTYNWSVIGGTIVGGWGTTSIRVRWDNVDTLGFGYVMLAEPCSPCPETTTVKIPVILKDAPIQGPSVACTDHIYYYSLPLWPATEYTWGAMGGPTIKLGHWVDYRPDIEFVTPGTYDLHARYQNELTLCGGNVFRTITVWKSTFIDGPKTICEGQPMTYSLADPTLTGSWTITDDTGAVVVTGSGVSIVNTFTPGRYMIYVTGTLCADPIQIIVKPLPPIVTTITGSNIPICIGHTNSYVAGPDVPGSTYEWKAIGGRVSPATGNNTVNVKWDSVSYKDISVRRFNKESPFCESPWLTIQIYEDTVKPKISGDTAVCANGYFDYDSHYTTGDTYDWTVYPSAAGSITAGAHSPVVTVLWSDVTAITTATLVLVAHKCDSVGSDTVVVNIHPGRHVAITPLITAFCPGDPVAITATAGDSLYLWSFGDGSTATTTLNVVTNSFGYAPGADYVTKVTVIPHKKGGCEAFGSDAVTIPILPGFKIYANQSDAFCDGIGSMLVATLTYNVGITVGWYTTGGYPVASGDTLLPGAGGTYYCIGVDSNGCTAVSDSVVVETHTCPPTHREDHLVRCPIPADIKSTATCNRIDLIGDPFSTVFDIWKPYITPATISPSGLNSRITWVTYDLPGIYEFEYYSKPDCDTGLVKDTIHVIPKYHYTIKCGTGGYDTIFLSDRTLYLPFDTIVTITWEDMSGPTTIGTGANVWYRVPSSGGPYTIRETVDGLRPPDEVGNTFSCDVTNTIAVPNYAVTPTFTASVPSICTGLPVHFTPTFTETVTDYSWDMGDGTTSLLHEPERSYDYTGLGYTTYTVTLTVKDSIGCPGSYSQTVEIHPNLLAGMMDPGGTMCPQSVPFALGYTATGASIPVSYTWSTGATTTLPTLNTSVSGDYFLYATDVYGCSMNAANYESVIVIATPKAEIKGDMEYCAGELVRLNGNVGDDVLYRWFRNDTLVDSAKILVDGILPAGNYGYKLAIGLFDSVSSIFCWDTSAVDTVRIHPLPPKPVILPPALLDTPSYHIQLTATEPNPGLFNWSNGTIGAVQDIYTGGQYKVWFTDIYGCINFDTVKVPMAPETYFPYFPVGCYNICSQQLPITLRARPDENFAYHAWLMNGGIAQWGTNMHIQPYNVAVAGDYQWVIGNGLCTQTSGTMSLSLTNCNCSTAAFPAGVTATVTCNPATPISYDITIVLTSPMGGSTYKLGTDRGPVAPFSGVLPTTGIQPPMTLTYTYVGATGSIIVGDSVTVEVEFTQPGGSKCFVKQKVPLPRCTWVPFYKPGREDTATKVNIHDSKPVIGSALLVFPNPSSGQVTVSYDYGTDRYNTRTLVIYDELGRELKRTAAPDIHGSWSLDAAGWAPGMYLIRMEADGKALQIGKIMITH